MMSPWHKFVLQILEHFDANEGTTYLYDDFSREEFVKQVDPSIRDEVSRLLDEYHSRAKNKI